MFTLHSLLNFNNHKIEWDKYYAKAKGEGVWQGEMAVLHFEDFID